LLSNLPPKINPHNRNWLVARSRMVSACSLVQLPYSTFRYVAHPKDDVEGYQATNARWINAPLGCRTKLHILSSISDPLFRTEATQAGCEVGEAAAGCAWDWEARATLLGEHLVDADDRVCAAGGK
jgi:hypothetical protein